MITFIESGNRIATENFEIGEIYTITFTNGNYKTMCCVGIGSDFVMFQDKLPNALFCLTLGTSETVSTIELGGGGGSTMNYTELENKPQINGIVLIGNKTSSDLGLLSQADLDNYVTDTELTTELAYYATNVSVVSALASKQDQLTTPQLTAVNSGITSSLVTQIGTNTTAIAGKQDTLTTPQLTAVNSGITSSLVNQITTNKNNISNVQTSLAVGSSDNGKVLTASYSGGTGSYAWVTPSGGGSASVVEGYISSNHTKFYSDSAKTIEIAGEANKLYVDRTNATTDGYSLYKWAYNDDNSSFVRAGSEVVKGKDTYGIVKNGSSVTSATGYTACPIISGVPYYKDTTYSLVGTKDSTGLIKNGSTVTSSSGYTASPIINGIPYYKNTTYNNATTSTAGLMSATDKSNLNKTPKVLVRSETSITASTSLADTGVSYTISANKYVRITASARYSSSNPVEIKIGTGSSDFAHVVAQSGDNTSSLTAVAYVGGYSSSTTAKVYAKFSSSGTNYILLCVEEIPSV